MAEKKKKKKVNNKKEPKKTFKNPVKTSWGKILVLILVMAMALVSFAMLIYYIVTMASSV